MAVLIVGEDCTDEPEDKVIVPSSKSLIQPNWPCRPAKLALLLATSEQGHNGWVPGTRHPCQIRLLDLGWWPSGSEGEDLEGGSSYLPLFMTVNPSARSVMEAAALMGPWEPGLSVSGFFYPGYPAGG